MIRSMTGFGRSSFEVSGRSFDVEVRSVNHRHLDVRVRLPRAMSDREQSMKALVGERLGRGKVDLNINPTGGSSLEGELRIEASVAAQYVAAARALAETHGLADPLDAPKLMAMPGVTRFVEVELPEGELDAALAAGVRQAIDGLLAMREREGEALAKELSGRLDRVLALVDSFEARSEVVVEAAKERLRKRIEQIRQDTGLLDEARLHQEIVLAADRLDITEELVRLRSHVDQFRALLGERDEPVGRRLDFLLQEMGREANTVGSKASDAPLAHDVVELKAELERIREQAQNVE